MASTRPAIADRAAIGPASPLAALRVLVVDDDELSRLIVAAALSRWYIAPMIARSGKEALRLACESPFDLILMGLITPTMGGFIASRNIRRVERSRPFLPPATILAYTNAGVAMREVLLQRSGFNGSLAKPCDSSSMADCLARWGMGPDMAEARSA